MTTKVFSAIVADDLTGATTTGALLAARGVKNVVTIGDVKDVPADSIDALLVSTDSRQMAPEDAYSVVKKATEELVALGGTHFSKRTDTTMRGGIGYEIDAMLDVLGEEYVAVIVPAMPPSKRVVVAGYSLIDSVLLSRTGVAQDILSPITDSYLPTLLGKQIRGDLAFIGIGNVMNGHDAIEEKLRAYREQGYRYFLCDSVSDEDVAEIARAVTDLGWKTLCVDPGMFTTEYALAQGIAYEEKTPKAALRIDSSPTDRGTVIVVAGSATATTRMQLGYLQQLKGTSTLEVYSESMIEGGFWCEEETKKVVRRASQLLETNPPRILLITLDTTLSGAIVNLDKIEKEKNLEHGEGARNLAKNLAHVAQLVMEMYSERLAGLYCTGGDTLVNTCEAINAGGISLEDYVIPQSDQGRIVGGPFDGLPVVGKGGLTGTEHTAVRIVNRLFDERKIND
ncbi:four-carbon acid sugar kinase family protein [Actinotignum urinale]|uniref:Four-carbon acid sugar kinase family protein n=1 Tax=Actinotignum urinale TaxID=190146 RepID=A0ABU5GAX8_9ACTO|nr:four-carbon acid sugar kinase family protein [Actinotignum urinale]MDY5132788.1 four-carbon acid sugar kinase family protein [Actinotignum urinale]MDY5159801.1 four-carbon acid sugar kinase family protein [Actinotignum urinale]